MINIYIPQVAVTDNNRQTLFMLTRPFITKNYVWKNDLENFKKWGIDPTKYQFVDSINNANLVLLPLPINHYFRNGMQKELQAISELCGTRNITAYSYIAGDYGEQYKEFPNLIYFRMGGFKSRLPSINRGFPVALTDHLSNQIFSSTDKKLLPTVGFCGHSTLSFKKRVFENIKFAKENFRRFLTNPLRSDYEPLFPSAFRRAQLLRSFEMSDQINCNFIYRNQYRAGAKTAANRAKTTEEYFDNIKNSDYVLCVRGGGNFSVRLYETLMMGKIPVFVNTDCLLPFEQEIVWKNHVVWVEWKDRKNIAQLVVDFHKNTTSEAFSTLQLNNRILWKETLSISGMLKLISDDI